MASACGISKYDFKVLNEAWFLQILQKKHGTKHKTPAATRYQNQDGKGAELVDHFPPNLPSMAGGVEDCTFKDMIPIKNRFSNLDLYPGKASKQKIITINSRKYVWLLFFLRITIPVLPIC